MLEIESLGTPRFLWCYRHPPQNSVLSTLGSFDFTPWCTLWCWHFVPSTTGTFHLDSSNFPPGSSFSRGNVPSTTGTSPNPFVVIHAACWLLAAGAHRSYNGPLGTLLLTDLYRTQYTLSYVQLHMGGMCNPSSVPLSTLVCAPQYTFCYILGHTTLSRMCGGTGSGEKQPCLDTGVGFTTRVFGTLFQTPAPTPPTTILFSDKEEIPTLPLTHFTTQQPTFPTTDVDLPLFGLGLAVRRLVCKHSR